MHKLGRRLDHLFVVALVNCHVAHLKQLKGSPEEYPA